MGKKQPPEPRPQTEVWYCWKEWVVVHGEIVTRRLMTPWRDAFEHETPYDLIFRDEAAARQAKAEDAPDEDWVLCRETIEPLLGGAAGKENLNPFPGQAAGDVLVDGILPLRKTTITIYGYDQKAEDYDNDEIAEYLRGENERLVVHTIDTEEINNPPAAAARGEIPFWDELVAMLDYKWPQNKE